MIDGDDADFTLLASMGVPGFLGIALLILAIVFYFVAAGNEEECERAKCPEGLHGKLVDNECVCLVKVAP